MNANAQLDKRQEVYTMTLYYNTVCQNAGNAFYPHKIAINSPEDLKIAVSYDHVCAEYKDGYRKNANFIQSDCSMFDVDNSETDNPDELAIEKQHGSIDNFYHHFIKADPSLNTLVLVLSEKNSKYNLSQMGEALTAEYLRNVGYDISKPDRHIRRILGSKYLGCSESEIVPIYEAFDIVAEIAAELGKPVAEVDYILWSYCANGYGEVCTLNKPKCEKCVAKEYCKKECQL